MSEASDKHDEQCANLKKAAAICEQRGQGLVDSVIALQAKVEELTKATGGTCEKHPQLQVPVGCICHYCLDEVRRATITEQQAKVEELEYMLQSAMEHEVQGE